MCGQITTVDDLIDSLLDLSVGDVLDAEKATFGITQELPDGKSEQIIQFSANFHIERLPC